MKKKIKKSSIHPLNLGGYNYGPFSTSRSFSFLSLVLCTGGRDAGRIRPHQPVLTATTSPQMHATLCILLLHRAKCHQPLRSRGRWMQVNTSCLFMMFIRSCTLYGTILHE